MHALNANKKATINIIAMIIQVFVSIISAEKKTLTPAVCVVIKIKIKLLRLYYLDTPQLDFVALAHRVTQIFTKETKVSVFLNRFSQLIHFVVRYFRFLFLFLIKKKPIFYHLIDKLLPLPYIYQKCTRYEVVKPV